MSADTNPFELIAQWRKAEAIKDLIIAHGQTEITCDEMTRNMPEWDEFKDFLEEAVPLASRPSDAVIMLAAAMVEKATAKIVG